MPNAPADDELVREFEETLNRHGYGFQFAVIKEIERLRYEERAKAGWHFVVSEFPVNVVQGEGTRIDFVLKYYTSRFYLLAECKRVNPAFGSWLFARAPESSIRRSTERKAVRVQSVQWDTAANEVFLRSGQMADLTEKLYHVGIPVRSPKAKGDRADHPATTRLRRRQLRFAAA